MQQPFPITPGRFRDSAPKLQLATPASTASLPEPVAEPSPSAVAAPLSAAPDGAGTYHRYHIETREAPDVVRHPSRFRVKVKRHKLVGMVLHELLFEYRGAPRVALSRPCVYGVFGRVVGGLAPIHEKCVGCLRCTTQYPEMVAILPNPERERLGDSFLTPDQVDTILLESRTGAVPVRGAGYRGRFGGEGWDGMWTDMSEIVRPTRDGIHGREFISTSVDLGGKPDFLHLDASGDFSDALPPVLSLPLPLLFETPPRRMLAPALSRVLAGAAEAIDTLALLPLPQLIEWGIAGPQVVPVMGREHEPLLDQLTATPRMLEIDPWDEVLFGRLAGRFPEAVIAVRLPMDADPVPLVRAGVGTIHLVADLHGRVGESFALDLILAAHRRLLAERLRERVTLIGSGGIVAAEHVPKAILAGLDAVALDSAAWVALQGELGGECRDREGARVRFEKLPEAWGVQRLQNLAGAWRDQLLEILGAMGLREVRRLRGELGRCMFQRDLEREAFGEIEGFA